MKGNREESSQKIGVLTFHRTTNFGSALQTFALYKEISNLGFECEIIDYRCDEIEKRENLGKIKFSFNPKKIVRDLLFLPGYQRKAEALRSFAEKNTTLSPTYTIQNISESLDRFTKFVVGSDIVWGRDITKSDYTYFLDFVNDANRKYAFASSVGDYSKFGDEDKVASLLNNFNKIAVREEDAVEWMESIQGPHADWVCDPTMLLTCKEWFSYITPENYNQKYILVYFNAPDRKNLRDAKEMAKKMGCMVFCINYDRPIKGVVNVKPTTLNEFLGLINSAAMVFTASYHGMLFSIYFHREFLFYTRAHKSRVLSLADRLGLQENCGDDIKIDEYKSIDYEKVDHKVDIFRTESIEILKGMLSD